jgi:hypothetical protein
VYYTALGGAFSTVRLLVPVVVHYDLQILRVAVVFVVCIVKKKYRERERERVRVRERGENNDRSLIRIKRSTTGFHAYGSGVEAAVAARSESPSATAVTYACKRIIIIITIAFDDIIRKKKKKKTGKERL